LFVDGGEDVIEFNFNDVEGGCEFEGDAVFEVDWAGLSKGVEALDF
jgi:hypothetical protein